MKGVKDVGHKLGQLATSRSTWAWVCTFTHGF